MKLYNFGAFEKMRNVGAGTVQELLDLDLATAVVPEEEPVPEVETVLEFQRRACTITEIDVKEVGEWQKI